MHTKTERIWQEHETKFNLTLQAMSILNRNELLDHKCRTLVLNMKDPLKSAEAIERAVWSLQDSLGMEIKELYDFMLSVFPGEAKLEMDSGQKLGNLIFNSAVEMYTVMSLTGSYP